MFLVGLEHRHDILRIVLTIAIEGDGISKTHRLGLTESSLQSCTLTTVLVERHHRQSVLDESCEDTGRGIGTTVVDHNHVVALLHRTSHHTTNGSAVVIRRNHHADASGS